VRRRKGLHVARRASTYRVSAREDGHRGGLHDVRTQALGVVHAHLEGRDLLPRARGLACNAKSRVDQTNRNTFMWRAMVDALWRFCLPFTMASMASSAVGISLRDGMVGGRIDLQECWVCTGVRAEGGVVRWANPSVCYAKKEAKTHVK